MTQGLKSCTARLNCRSSLHQKWRRTQNLDFSTRCLQGQEAIPVYALQTPSVLPAGTSRVDHYVGHVQDVLGTLPAYLRAQVQCVVGDAYYSKITFVEGVIRAGFAFVGKLRVDANLKYKYTGPRTGKPGRPKQFDGKVERLKPVRCCCEGQELEGFLEMDTGFRS